MVSRVCAIPDQREPGTPVKNILLGSMSIINYMDQHTLDKYFSTHWHSNIDQYEYSGWALVQKIKLGESVLDVGCGTNPFRDRIANLTGIDPAFDQADYKCTIEQFESNIQFNVAFCLGSINFGSEAIILKQIGHVVDLLTPHARIYWRCNPGRQDHGNEHCQEIDFFNWTPELLHQYAEQFGFRVADLQQDSNNRIYCEWIR